MGGGVLGHQKKKKERGGQVWQRQREVMIDVQKKKETEDLVRRCRKVQIPATQMSAGRAVAVVVG